MLFRSVSQSRYEPHPRSGSPKNALPTHPKSAHQHPPRLQRPCAKTVQFHLPNAPKPLYHSPPHRTTKTSRTNLPTHPDPTIQGTPAEHPPLPQRLAEHADRTSQRHNTNNGTLPTLKTPTLPNDDRTNGEHTHHQLRTPHPHNLILQHTQALNFQTHNTFTIKQLLTFHHLQTLNKHNLILQHTQALNFQTHNTFTIKQLLKFHTTYYNHPTSTHTHPT